MRRTVLFLLSALLLLTACGGGGSSSGSATRAKWTYMVYLAADNDLAVSGLIDLIDEMAAVGSNADVKIVVMAEFSNSHTAQYNLDASGVGLPSFATTRYLINAGGYNVRTSPSDRNMASPATLAQFITDTVASDPADHYALVLWNHGDSFVGICQDETSNDIMDLVEMRQALTTANVHFDLINCDACLMARYEVAAAVSGFCDYLVASQLTEPGAGDPYHTILTALKATPTMTAAQLAQTICSAFVSSYGATPGTTVTKSALAMSGYAGLRTALEDLGAALTTALGSQRAAIEAARDASIALFDNNRDRDLGDFLARLAAANLSTDITTKANAAATALDAAVIAANFTNGTRAPVTSMTGSTGLGTALPARFPDQGPESQTAYHAAMASFSPNWAGFVEALASSGGTVDYGTASFGWAIVWNDPAVDVDLYVNEADGNWASPWMGTVSTYGYLSSDSLISGEPVEIYIAKENVQAGTFDLCINLAGNASIEVQVYELVNGNWVLSTPASWSLDQLTPAPSPTTLGDIQTNLYSNWKWAGAVTVGSN